MAVQYPSISGKRAFMLLILIGLDFAGTARTVAYPGTEYFERNRDSVEFSLFPYRNELKDAEREKELLNWEKEFYKGFYFSKKFIFKTLMYVLKYPVEMLAMLKDFFSFDPSSAEQNNARNDFI